MSAPIGYYAIVAGVVALFVYLAYLVASAAERRGRSFTKWFAAGVALGWPFTLLAFLIFGNRSL